MYIVHWPANTKASSVLTPCVCKTAYYRSVLIGHILKDVGDIKHSRASHSHTVCVISSVIKKMHYLYDLTGACQKKSACHNTATHSLKYGFVCVAAGNF